MSVKLVPLSKLVKFENGYAFKSDEYSEAGYFLMRITNVQKGYISLNNPKYVDIPTTQKNHEQFILCEGDVLISLTGDVGRVGIIEKHHLPAVLNQRVARIKIISSSELDQRYLFSFLNSEFTRREIEKLGNGVAQLNVSTKDIGTITIPLPPLEEQRRIAEQLDAADRILRLREASIAKLDQLAQSVFVEMFGDPFSKKTETIKLGEVATIDMGQSPAGATYNSNGEGVYLLNGPTEFGEKYPIPLQWTSIPTKMCKDGDVLFCVRGATAGKLNISNGNYCIGRGLAAIRSCNLDFANNEFIYMLLKQYYSYFQNKGVGSTFINISKDDLINLPIPKVKKDSLVKFQKFEVENSNQKSLLERQRLDMSKMIASIQHQSFAVT